MSIFSPPTHFRPDDNQLTPNEKTRVQVNRLLNLFGVVLLLVFGVVRGFTGSGSTDPTWMRVGLGLLNCTLVGLSYVSAYVRRTYARWMEGIMYLSMAWIVLLTQLNAFSAPYVVGLMFVFTAFSVVIAFGRQKVPSVFWFTLFTMVIVGIAFDRSPSSEVSLVLLWTTLGALAILEAIIIRAWSSLQEKVKEQKEFLQSITDNVSDAILRVKPGDGFVYANQAFVDMFGYDCAGEVCSVDPSRIYENPEERPRMQRLLEDQGELDGQEIEFRRKDGSTFLGLVNASVAYDDNGNVEYYDAAVYDISERKAYERALREERDRFEALFESLPTPVVCCSPSPEGTVINEVNPAFEQTFGIPTEEAPGQDIDAIIVPDGEQDSAAHVERQALMDGHVFAEVRRKTPNGVKDFQLQVSSRTGSEGQPEFYAIYTDVSEQKRREEQLEHEVLHDSLTGVPNRVALRRELETRVADSDEEALSALLYLDLDRFKQVNDRLGHSTGDQVLIRTGERLQSAVRASDLVARIGGDEFAVCLSDVRDRSMVYRIAQRIHDELSRPVEVNGETACVGASIGTVVGLADYDAVDEALRDADAAMYEAKENTREAFVAFEDFPVRTKKGE